MPVHFIAMDVIVKFKLLHQGHQYALTVIDMLTNYTWCILLFTKEADEVVYTYLVHMYSKFCGLHKILSDNDTEFKNKFLPLSEWNRYSVPLIILKAVSALTMYVTFWRCTYDNMSPLNLYSKESAFFLMIGKDVYAPLVQLSNPKLDILVMIRACLLSEIFMHWWFIIQVSPT